MSFNFRGTRTRRVIKAAVAYALPLLYWLGVILVRLALVVGKAAV